MSKPEITYGVNMGKYCVGPFPNKTSAQAYMKRHIEEVFVFIFELEKPVGSLLAALEDEDHVG